jgi:ComF family protein
MLLDYLPIAIYLLVAVGFGAVVDFFYPPLCPLCLRRLTREDDTVCYDCLAELALRPAWRCPHCGGAGVGGEPHPGRPCRLCPPEGMAYRGVFSVGAYGDHAARCVQHFKYHRRLELGELMARLMTRHLAGPIERLRGRIDCVAPVPLHWARRLHRGFNQSDLLGRELAKTFGLSYDARLLKRKRFTKRQALVPRERRAENVKDAFALRGKPAGVRGTGILLVDDVVTSGHTIHECAKVLIDAGAREVWVASFARAGMDRAMDEE